MFITKLVEFYIWLVLKIIIDLIWQINNFSKNIIRLIMLLKINKKLTKINTTLRQLFTYTIIYKAVATKISNLYKWLIVKQIFKYFMLITLITNHLTVNYTSNRLRLNTIDYLIVAGGAPYCCSGSFTCCCLYLIK